MKRSIRHLPEKKQYELHKIVSYITANRPVEMVILFGSYARGNWVEDRYTEDGITYEYKSDYDLLVVVEDEKKALLHQPAKRLKKKIKKYVDPSVPVNLIYHGIEYLNQEIGNGNYFFTDILKEGIRLYHSKRYTLSKPRNLTAEDRLQQARDYFKQWFESANEFFTSFHANFNRRSFKLAAFELHQATERYYMTALLVFTGYKPKTHDLEELDFRAGRLDARFKQVFPNKTEEEERLFGLLKKAYIDARYKMDYAIEKEELEYLAGRVELLQEITAEVCKERLERAD